MEAQDDLTPNAEIYLYVLNEVKGPYTIEQVRALLSDGQISGKTKMKTSAMSDWEPIGERFSDHLKGKNIIGNISGLGHFEGFSFSNFVGGIFRNHDSEEMTDFFCCGSSKTTPPLLSINPIWPSPWIFARLIVFSFLLYSGLYYTLATYEENAIFAFPALLFVGNFAIPFCTLILFMELNVQRNISFNRVVAAFLAGGVLSTLLTFLISERVGSYEAYIAGPVEEPAKLLAAIFLGRKFRDGRILTGLVFGAAVGAGFAAFESAGYSLVALFKSSDGEKVMLTRAFLAPFCHVVWTAVTTGAFWFILGERRKSQQEDGWMSCMTDARFVRIVWIPVVLHMLWNGMIPAIYIKAFPYCTHIILGVIAWVLALLLVQKGINQIKIAQEEQAKLPSTPEENA